MTRIADCAVAIRTICPYSDGVRQAQREPTHPRTGDSQMQTFTFAQPSNVGSGFATRSMIDGCYADDRDFRSGGLLAGVHAIPTHVVEAIMFNHGIEKTIESESGDKFVEWRGEFTGEALSELLELGKFQSQEIEARKDSQRNASQILERASQKKQARIEAAIRCASI